MREIGRRGLLLGGSALLGAGLVGACTGATSDPGHLDADRKIIRNQKLRGRIVVAPLQNPPKAARDALTREYRRRHPDVEVVWASDDSLDVVGYSTWLTRQLSEPAKAPDIVSGNYQSDFGGYVDFEEYRTRTNPYTGGAWDEAYRFDLFRNLDNRGRRALIATEAMRPVLFYNKALFDSAGVEPRPRSTWSEFVADCAKLKKAGIDVPISTNYDFVAPNWFPSIYFDQYHVDWVDAVRAQPGDWCYDPEIDGRFEVDATSVTLHRQYTYSPQRFFRALRDKEIGFDTASVEAVIRNLSQLFPKYSNPDFFSRTDQYTPFLQQRAAMMVDGSWAMNHLRRDLEEITPKRQEELQIEAASVDAFDWDIMEFPAMDDGNAFSSTTRPPEDLTGYYLSVVNKDAEQTALATDFLMFWISKPGYDTFLAGHPEAEQASPQGYPLISGVRYADEVQNLLDKARPKGAVGPAYGTFWVGGGGGKATPGLKKLYADALRRTLTPAKYRKQLQAHIAKHYWDLVASAGLTRADIEAPARRPAGVRRRT